MPGLGPPIRMRIMGVVYVKIIQQLSLKVVDRTKVPALEKTAGQHPKPPFHLIEPRRDCSKDSGSRVPPARLM